MKLIIDIPTYVYEIAKGAKCIIDADNELVARAIAKGTPFEELKDNIKSELLKVLEIIDE